MPGFKLRYGTLQTDDEFNLAYDNTYTITLIDSSGSRYSCTSVQGLNQYQESDCHGRGALSVEISLDLSSS